MSSYRYVLTYVFDGEKRVIAQFETNYSLSFVRQAIPRGSDVIGQTRGSFGPVIDGVKYYNIGLSYPFRELIKFLEQNLEMRNLSIIQGIRLQRRPQPCEEIRSELQVELA